MIILFIINIELALNPKVSINYSCEFLFGKKIKKYLANSQRIITNKKKSINLEIYTIETN